MEIFGFIGKYYYLIIILQAFCVYHCIKKGNQNWIWLIVFLPAIGCLIYFFTEVFTRREASIVQDNLSNIVVPSARLRKLQRQLDFSDTFQNRVDLADEYLNIGMTDEAISLYEMSLDTMFQDNPYVLMRLIEAYSIQGRYSDILPIGQKIKHQKDFIKSRAHVQYAIALEKEGKNSEAEAEYQLLKGRYSGFEGRYYYALFLLRNNRNDECDSLINAMLQEASRMSYGELRNHREWVRKAKELQAKGTLVSQ